MDHESEDAITEALSIIKGWNPDWKPRYFMTDYSKEEINAIRKLFGTHFYYLLIILIKILLEYILVFIQLKLITNNFNTIQNVCVIMLNLDKMLMLMLI